MLKSILVLMVLSVGVAEASPKSMRRYLDGDISADQYFDSIGVPKSPTAVIIYDR